MMRKMKMRKDEFDIVDKVVAQAVKKERQKWMSAVEDIKAEIEEKISHYDHFQGSNTAHGLEIALEIIDKHIERDKK